MRAARWKMATALVAAGMLVGSIAGYAASSGAATSAIPMAAGDTANVTCAGPQLRTAAQSATALVLTCDPNPVTTTTAPATTTTLPATTTTVPATTTTVPATTTTVPATTTTVSSGGAFPDATNTGVPAGTVLTNWTGGNITTCRTLSGYNFPNGVTVTATNGTHSASTPCVTITNSKVTGVLFVGYSGAGPTVVSHTEIVGVAGSTNAPLWQDNFYGYYLNVHGGRGQVDCDGYCELHDSYVHDENFAGATH